MKEQELYLLITRYLSNQTSTEENEQLADWLAANKNNEQTFEEVKKIWLGYKRSADADSVAALSKLHTRISSEAAASPGRSNIRRIRYYPIAATVLFFLTLGWFIFPTLRNIQKPDCLVSTQSGQKKKVVLEDGTMVMLGPESTLSYPATFSKDIRKIAITGEAYFEVSKNPHRPFVVHTATLNVQVLGTHFNVSAVKNQGNTTVSLLEGKVKVDLNDEDNATYLLKPGQELTFNHLSRQVFQHKLDTASVLGWLHNTLVFKGETLGNAAPKIEKMYGVKIVFGDQETAESHLFATFNNQPITRVMNTICATGVLTYYQEGHNIYINQNTKNKTTR